MIYFANTEAGGYTESTSNEVGIGLLVESAAKAATVESCGFLTSGAPFLAIQTGSRKARQLPHRGFTGRPTCLDCRPDWSLSGSHQTTEPSEPNMAHINHISDVNSTSRPELTQAQLRTILSYDIETGAFTWLVSKKGPGAFAGRRAGSTRHDGYIQIKLEGRKYWAHRLVWLWMYGFWPDQNIDHIDGNPSNNAISNLRDVSQSFNVHNIRKEKSGKTSGLPRGVSLNPYGNYIARIRATGFNAHIGTFKTITEAELAYKNARIERHPGFVA